MISRDVREPRYQNIQKVVVLKIYYDNIYKNISDISVLDESY